ncbi:hypothetical protein ACFO6R_11475 [Eubacterium multiforme]|uniref:Transposase-like protein n=1 Tax=Eubacterium multiforme TaxID=83339 RepID=A0ABT9UWH1_9FIRM|nr:hypothetical protein [Eubacterium multiforme]MDQ0150682.1 transposase-like protein [Eubacterium multiforme]
MRVDITSIQENKPITIKQSMEAKSFYVVLNYSPLEKAILINIVANSCIDSISNESKRIEVAYQKTGFGFKRFFKCPYCGSRRKYLYPVGIGRFACSNCLERNVYAYRTNIYDGNIEKVIKYKIIKNLFELDFDLDKLGTMNIRDINRNTVNMFNLLGNIPSKPKYMRWNKYEEICKKIYFLDFIYWQVADGRIKKLKVKELKDMLNKNNVNFVYENIIAPIYFKEIYKEVN